MTDDVSTVIGRHAAALALPGVLSLRPGFLLRDGVLTGTPAIVATVATVAAGSPAPALPAEIEGLPVDVRIASERKALRLTDPAAYARLAGTSPDLGSVPEFGDEVRVMSAGVTARVEPGIPPLAVSAAASKPQLPYTGPAGASLASVVVEGPITLSASPDTGWATLAAFLQGTASSLTIGLYDFTSAHVLAAFEKAAAGKAVTLVLDHPAKNPTADQTDEQTVAALDQALGSSFEQAWALERMDPKASAWIFPTAYHMKVAVRDSKAVWLSSGNWNNSNQPDIAPTTNPADAAAARAGDRDWHVVVDDAGLAGVYEAFLKHDHEVAAAHNVSPTVGEVIEPAFVRPAAQTPPFTQFFPSTTIAGPTTVTPLLTPDPGVYVDAVTKLVESATTTLHLQFQYIELPKTASPATQPFADLVAAVIARQKAGVDVKIVMSEFESAGYLEQLQSAGLDVAAAVRLQNNVHNKGMVVDGARVLVSSQNWSSAGVLSNRDAGVILESSEAAAYFDRIFLHDWQNLATLPVQAD
ncbi:phospholipase D-like domain-containing protein [Frondihabitans cladoniiphilus]